MDVCARTPASSFSFIQDMLSLAWVPAGSKHTEPWEAQDCTFLDCPLSLLSVCVHSYVIGRKWVPVSKQMLKIPGGNKML